jgi:hypothetical protein
VNLKEVAPQISKHFGEVFGLEMQESSRDALLEKLEQTEQTVEVVVS